jgi:hypothetical protein
MQYPKNLPYFLVLGGNGTGRFATDADEQDGCNG